MADTLKFGPEWLRQLSGGNSVGTPPPSPAPGFGKYKLAKHRYGREEMLALFTKCDVPEELKQYAAILADKAQDPLAFQPISEEEQRLSQSMNSQAVLRMMMGRGSMPVRGRGGAADRGRGRGRGRGDGYMQRGLSYDDVDSSGAFGRARQRPDGSWDEGDPKLYQRQQYQGGSRYDTTAQPGKVYVRSFSSDNWREREDDEDDGDWRKAGSKGWNESRGGIWREGSRDKIYDYDRLPPDRLQKGFVQPTWRAGENWDEEGMPEWSVDGDPDELGTFDSSGAFVSPKKVRTLADEDKESGNDGENESRSGIVTEDKVGHKAKEEVRKLSNNEKDSSHNKSKGEEFDKEKLKGKTEKQIRKDINTEKQKEKSDIKSKVDYKKGKTKSERAESPISPKQVNSAQSCDKIQTYKIKQSGSPVNNLAGNQKDKSSPDVKSGSETVVSCSEDKTSTQNNLSTTNKLRDVSETRSDSNSPSASENTQTNVPKNKDSNILNKQRKKVKSEAEALDQLQETVENMVAGITIIEDEDSAEAKVAMSIPKPPSTVLSADHENYSKWFYRDPQGDLQGPFTSTEMAEWFSAGYFTMNLLVRRGCDEKFCALGELIKRWDRVPFLPGVSPPPLMNSVSADVVQQPVTPVTSPSALQQQQLQSGQPILIDYIPFLQHQILSHSNSQQELLRHLQLQQLVTHMQENEAFKSLSLQQQHQLAMQVILQQGHSTIIALTQSSSQELKPKLLESPTSSPSQSHPPFNRCYSTPNTNQGQILPASIWDVDPTAVVSMPSAAITAAEHEAREKEKEQLDAEKRHRQKQMEELSKKQEEFQRQKEEFEREKLEIERQRLEELKKIEEEHRKSEEKRKLEEEEELRRKIEEKKIEEKKRKKIEEDKKEEERKIEERHREELERQQQLQKQQEAQRLKEQDEKQKQIDQQKRQELRQHQEENLRKQQNEALKKLQQEQLANMQLPSHAQWACNQSPLTLPQAGKSLLEIQQQEEKDGLEYQETQRKKQMEIQRQMIAQQQQHQQQQKSWTNTVPVKTSTKSLLEIQQEQARQLERERQKREENHQIMSKTLTIGAASVWGTSPPNSNWANEGAWGALKSAQVNANNSHNSLGFWDDAIISTSGPVNKQPSKPGKPANSDFPALKGDGMIKPKEKLQNKAKPAKTNKDEEAVQRIFSAQTMDDDFTMWCKTRLKNMDTSVDIPTFVSFLQEVESPYEVHDYIHSYLGENKASEDFGKAYLVKRSQYKNKFKPVQEDSIWGPAPAVTPKELRLPVQSLSEDGQKGKANKKKKNKMMKVDNSILGFTVHAAPDRIVGEIESLNNNAR